MLALQRPNPKDKKRRPRIPILGEEACESFIERRLYRALARVVPRESIRTQWPIGPYRADLTVKLNGRRLVIEADGAAYHEGRREQDARRDAYMSGRGWRVLRFTGKQINGDARECARAVLAALA